MCISNEILLCNINSLCRETNRKKSEIEEEVGVSSGYFARLSKTPSTFPIVDVLLKLSEIFGVNIDLLLKQNINSMGQNNRMIYKLVTMLCQRTIDGDIQWKELSSICSLGEIKYEREFPSDYKMYLNDNPYEAKMDDGLIIGIQPLKFKLQKNSKNKVKSATGYELYYSSGDKRDSICFSDLVDPLTRVSIEELASYIAREIQDVQIPNVETLDIIKSLLKRL